MVDWFLTRWVGLFAALATLMACSGPGTVQNADTIAPSASSNLTARTASATEIDLTWTASIDSGGSGLGGYHVYRDGNTTSIATVNVASTAYNDTGLTPNTSYTYTVRAFDQAGNESADSNVASATTLASTDTTAPSAPATLTASAVSASEIDLTWSASTDTGGSGLASYQIFRDGGTTPIATVAAAATTYQDTSVVLSTAYTYTVRAVDGAGNVSGDSPAASATTPTPADMTPPTAPATLTATAASSTEIDLSWGASTDSGGSGLAGYRIFRNGATTAIATVGSTVTTYQDTSVLASTTYSYTVKAVDGAGNVSAASPSASATTQTPVDTNPPTAPSSLSATAASASEIDLSWGASTDTGGSGLAGYRIFRNGGTSAIATVGATTTTFKDTTVAASTSYSYTVKAVDGAGNVSVASPTATARTPAPSDTTAPTTPATLTATAASATEIDLSWSASTDAGGSGLAGYRVYRNGSATAIATVGATPTTFNDTSVVASSTYSYTVKAIDGAGNLSGASPTASATTPAVVDTTPPTIPATLTATPVGATEIDLAWGASTDSGGSGLAGYRVYRNGGATAIASVGAGVTTYRDIGLISATAYTYTVQAIDGAGNLSGNSPSASATTGTVSSGSGLDSRPSNTLCVAPTRPTPSSSVALQRVFPSISFSKPLAMIQAPGNSTHWYVVQQGGKIMDFDTTKPTTQPTVFLDLTSKVNSSQNELGLLGLAFDPNWTSTHRAYVFYTATADSGSGGKAFRTTISRFTSSDNNLTLDSTTEQKLIIRYKSASNHNGGQLAFGPDGYLYAGLGDGGDENDPNNWGQNLGLLFGKIIRIDVSGSGYAIPGSNPYSGNPMCSGQLNTPPVISATACPEIYGYGFRNPWRFSFDKASSSSDMWVGDVGQDAWEEIDRVQSPGGNYGWSIKEAASCFKPSSGCPSTGADGKPLIDPLVSAPHSAGWVAIMGGFVYRGKAIPSLVGQYVFGNYSPSRISVYDSTQTPNHYRDILTSAGTNNVAIAAFGQDSDGELYAVDIGAGGLWQIVPASGGGANPMPTNLTDTGCVDPAHPTQPYSGLVPYTPNAPFWSDGAAKDRWIGLPNGSQITVNSDGDFTFPNGTVLVKNFSLNSKLVETRLFMRHPDGVWAGYSYEWNTAQTQATLVNSSGSSAVYGSQTWLYPSQSQCLYCHNAAPGYALGPEIGQLNGNILYPTTGRTANQVTTLSAIGMLTPAQTVTGSTPAYPAPFGTTDTLNNRARAYLHSNCSQCHRPGGPTPVNLDFRYSTALSATGACSVPPTDGDLGATGANILTPGNSALSVMYLRMSRRDANQMPPIATNQVDTQGAQLLSDWINSLSNCN